MSTDIRESKSENTKSLSATGSSGLVIGNSWKPAQELQCPSSSNLSTNEKQGAGGLTNQKRARGAWFQEFF